MDSSLRHTLLRTSARAAGTELSVPILQHKCARGKYNTAGGECAACSEDRQTLHRATRNPKPEIHHSDGVPPIVHEVLRSPGQPLDPATRAFFEPRFGHGFGQVRVHAYDKAAESARLVNALAYTVERNVIFGEGKYVLETAAGVCS